MVELAEHPVEQVADARATGTHPAGFSVNHYLRPRVGRWGAGVIRVVVTTRTYTANKRGQVTDRNGKAVALPAGDKLDERIGVLYVPERGRLLARNRRAGRRT